MGFKVKTAVSAYPKNSASLREIKKGLILKLILSGGKHSCAELGRALNVGRSTVLHVVRELKDEGLVEELGYGDTTAKGGRKPQELGIKSGSNFIISVYVRGVSLGVSVIDLCGSVLFELRKDLELDRGGEGLLKEMTALVKKAKTEFFRRKPSANILACGISFSGRVDPEKGMVLYEHNFGMRNVPVCDIVSSACGIPAYIDNRVVIGGIAEKWFGQARELKNFVYFQVLPSMRAVAFMNGKAFRGINHMAGEVGAIPVDDNGSTRRFICDEVDSSVFKLPGAALRYGLWNGEAPGSKVENTKALSDFLRIVDEFRYEKKDIDVVIKCAGKLLGSFIAFYDPETILFSGVPCEYGDYFIDEMKKILNSSMYMVPPESYKLRMAAPLSNRTALGMVGMVIGRILNQS